MSDVLVDSSAWIDFFRNDKNAVARVGALLADDRVATTSIVTAEVTSGAKTRDVFEFLRTRFEALPLLPEPKNLWNRVAETRFALARRGEQTHLVDLAIAHTALAARHVVLTRDRDFSAIAKVLAVDLDVF